MPQQYVLDYAYSMDGLDPFLLPMPSGWVTITNLLINGQAPSGSPPTVTVPANTQFYLTYDIVIGSSVPAGQHGWGDIVYTGTENQITEANSVWSNNNMGPGTYSVSINFINGINQQMNYTIRVGHVEYTLTAQSNPSTGGTVAVTYQGGAAPSSWYVGQVATLTATPASGYQFAGWSGGASGSANPLSYTFGAADATITANFSAYGTPTCDAGGPYTAQAENSIQFQGTISGGTAPYSYVWSFGDGTYAYEEDPVKTYATPGTYTATLSVTDYNNQTCSDTASVTVTTIPVALTCYAGNDQQGTVNVAMAFTATASGGTGYYSYSWAFGDGNSGTGNPGNHIYATAGVYTVTLTVNDGTSTCTDVLIATVSAGGCTTGETQCINGERWVCINGVWNNTHQPCCDLNDIKCENEQIYICDANNNWIPSGVVCCVPGSQKCVDGYWNTCNTNGDGWTPSVYPCQQDIPTEYIIIGGIAVVGGLVALAAASGGLGGYAIGRRKRK